MVINIFLFIFILPFTASKLSYDVEDLQYLYYESLKGEPRGIIYNDPLSLAHSNLSSGAPTSIIIDGFTSSFEDDMSQRVKNALLTQGTKRNVIVLDWSKLSGHGLGQNLTELELAVLFYNVTTNVNPIGERLSRFINFLKLNKEIKFSDVYLIGHSLGAHIAGATGMSSQRIFGETIPRISGLDPAGPVYDLIADADKRLDRTDASFVDICRTNGVRGGYGSLKAMGTIDVFVNGGEEQPGCADSATPHICSHSFSWRLLIESFKTKFDACPCEESGNCLCKVKCNTVCQNMTRVGIYTPTTASGNYHLTIEDPLII